MVLNIESLANELLLDLFEYISSVDLLHAFYGLNNRFDKLLHDHLQTHSLDFRSTSKTNFRLICQQYLPTFANSIYSIYLSDDDNEKSIRKKSKLIDDTNNNNNNTKSSLDEKPWMTNELRQLIKQRNKLQAQILNGDTNAEKLYSNFNSLINLSF